MNCPLDGTTLEIHTIHSVDVEECPQCKGLWFEQGELRKAKDDADPDLNWLDFDLWSDQESHSKPNCQLEIAHIVVRKWQRFLMLIRG